MSNFPNLLGALWGLQTDRRLSWNKLFFNTRPGTGWFIVTILFTFLQRISVRQGLAGAFIAIRDNDLASEMGGINIWYYKTLAFLFGCFFAGIAGSLWGT